MYIYVKSCQIWNPFPSGKRNKKFARYESKETPRMEKFAKKPARRNTATFEMRSDLMTGGKNWNPPKNEGR
jgi:hypothetical protein